MQKRGMIDLKSPVGGFQLGIGEVWGTPQKSRLQFLLDLFC